MAATTIHTLLVRLGFDVRGLEEGEMRSRAVLDRLQSTARKTGAGFAPAITSVNNFIAAIDRVGGSRGSAQALNNLATAATALTNSLRGTQAQASQVVENFSRVVTSIAGLGNSATTLGLLAKGVQEVSVATNGSVTAVNAWLKSMQQASRQGLMAATDTERFNLVIQESVRHIQQSANADKVRASILNSQVKMAVADVIVKEKERQAAAQQWINIQTKVALIEKAAAAERARIAREDWTNLRVKMALIDQLAQKERQEAAAEKLRLHNLRMEDNKFNWMMQNGGFGGASDGADRTARSIRGVGQAAEEAGHKVSYMQKVLSMAFAFSGGVAVTTVFAFIGDAVLGFNSKIQQAQIAFENFLGSADKATAFIQRMEDFANVTPFDFESLNTAVQRMIAMGFAAENEALPALRAIGDAVAGLGGSQDKLDRIAMALGQIKTAGRVTSQDMRQLTEAGIPAWEMLARAIGKTQGETRKLAEAGLIPANKALQALLSGMNERYGGMMERQARTAAGAFATLRDTVVQAVAGAVKPAFDLLTTGMVGLADFMLNGGGRMIAPLIYAIGVAIAVALIPRIYHLAISIASLKASMGMVQPTFVTLIALLTLIGYAWQENFMGIRDIAEPALRVLGQAVQALNDNAALLAPIIQALGAMIIGKFVVSLAASAAGWVANSIASAIYIKNLEGVAAASGAAAAGNLAVGATAGAAAAKGGVLSSVLGGIAALLGGVVAGAVVLFTAAIALLVLNFDRVTQGLRFIYMGFLLLEKAIADFLTSLPLVGGAFTWFKDHVYSELNDLRNEVNKTEQHIRDMEAASAAGNGTDAKTVFGQIDQEYQQMIDSLGKDNGQVVDAAQDLVKAFGTTLDGVKLAASAAGSEAMYQMAQGIEDAQSAPLNAFKDLYTKLKTPMEAQSQIAQLYGMLTSNMLAQGLASSDPAILAWAEGLQKNIVERLDALTDGAYTAGLKGGLSYLEAMNKVLTDPSLAHLSPDALERIAEGMVNTSAQKATEWLNKWKPSADAVASSMDKINKELAEMEQNTQSLSDLTSAFREIKSAAMEYFDAVHQRALQAIQDQLDHKNAILDAKMALNQGPVDAAQRALDARQAQIQEWRLREAIRTASTPEAYRDAVLALEQFLAQQHINEMQAEVDKANDVLRKRQEANRRKAEQDKEAENRRYEQMKRDFEYQLELLQEYLAKHPQEWASTEEQIIRLLHGYGFDFKDAGELLGDSFVQGLRKKLKAAREAAQALAEAASSALSGVIGAGALGTLGWENSVMIEESQKGKDLNGNGIIGLASGMWDTLNQNLFAMLHPNEMVAPASSASLIREFGSRPIDQMPVASAPMGRGGGGARTIIFQVGDEKLGELTDHSMYGQEMLYGGRGVQRVGGSAR